MKTRTLLAIAGLVVLVAPAGAVAAPLSAAAGATAERNGSVPTWDAWYGCWRPVGDDALGAGIVCILPGADATTARMVTVEDGVIAGETSLRADGVARSADEGGCTGHERAYWSRDGQRVFVRTELDCNGVQRVSTGVLALISEVEWIDAQALTVGDQHAARAIRYRAVRSESVPEVVAADMPAGRALARETARLRASAPLDLDAVVEAAGVVAPPALEALLAARQQGFDLDARTLIRLERDGVPAPIIDLMIALSYPRSFAVEQPNYVLTEPGVAWGTSRARYGYGMDCSDVFYADLRYRPECAYLFRYNRYGYTYGSRYGYSPWGYDPYGWRYGSGPVVVIVRPDPSDDMSGTVVRGQGYTRGTGGQSTGTAQPRSGTRSSAGTSTAPSRPAATTSSGTSAGSSTTGSGTSTGRTAKPRPAGGGDQEQ
jgi:hypothetical protein